MTITRTSVRRLVAGLLVATGLTLAGAAMATPASAQDTGAHANPSDSTTLNLVNINFGD